LAAHHAHLVPCESRRCSIFLYLFSNWKWKWTSEDHIP
jgi:hypothetical protein